MRILKVLGSFSFQKDTAVFFSFRLLTFHMEMTEVGHIFCRLRITSVNGSKSSSYVPFWLLKSHNVFVN